MENKADDVHLLVVVRDGDVLAFPEDGGGGAGAEFVPPGSDGADGVYGTDHTT